MDALDPYSSVSRLERAKALISKIVLSRPNDRFSLTVFSGEAFEAVPPTTDAAIFETLANGVSTKYSQSLGTDFGQALSLVANRYASGSSADGSPVAVMVLLTDGGDAEDTPETSAIRSAFGKASSKIAAVAVTIGSEDGATIPIGRDFFGNPILLTKGETPVITKANPKTAARVAAAARGEATTESRAYEVFRKWEDRAMPIDSDGAGNSPSTVPGFVLFAIAAFVAAFVIPDKIPV